ncbi:glycosyltransferase family 2 protein [Ideonella sp. B508-1]|uniref:glycosyltransferase family 2 protein n=1 Tax=Ideonella sp. B508-1 TaxID=137716 RepID=UPI000349908C|nr:glycosyltransferase [Ideonella sp. B508-1]
MKLTIAIPTFNRLPQLQQAIAAVCALEIPPGLELHLALSNIASRDGTRDYLDALQLPGIALHIYNTPFWEMRFKKDIRSNWVRLAGAVPRDSDWVWLHGDDDVILDPRALHRVVALARSAEQPRLLMFPQAKRSTGSGQHYAGQLIDLCQAHGFHEMLGWMSQLVMCGPLFFAAMSDFARFAGESLDDHDPRTEPTLPRRELLAGEDPQSAERLTDSRVSAFHHATMVLRHFRDQVAVFVDDRIIDEQPQLPPGQEDRPTRRSSENVRDRFFYLVDDFVEHLGLPPRSLSPHFLRYVNKSLADLMTNVLAEDLLVPGDCLLDRQGKLERLHRLRELMADEAQRQELSRRLALIEDAMRRESSESRRAMQALYQATKQPRLPFQIMPA